MSTKNTLIFLMDIDGHPGIEDNFAGKYRTYAFQDICNDNFLDRNKNVIVSTPFYSERSKELHHQATYDRGWKWYAMEKSEEFRTLEKMLRKKGFILSPENTTVIFGGTNTSGCVLHSSNLSLSQFAARGFHCQLYLPLCDDVHMPGIESHDRSQKAFSETYTFLKKNNHIDKVDVLTRFVDLDLKRSDRRFEYKST